MGNTIKFGVHRNPLKDAEGRETYHVRHETDFALNQDYIISKVKTYNAAEACHVNAVISVLKEQIVEILTDNHNVHIEGLGNFYLRLGFKEHTNENGQTVKPHFTDPSEITGNDVVVESIGFTPDEEFLGQLLKKQEEPFMILAVISKELRRLYTARIALDEGRDKFWLMEQWGMRSDYPARLLMDAARRTTREWCANSLTLCQKLDLRMKSEKGVDDEGEIKLLLMELAQKTA